MWDGLHETCPEFEDGNQDEVEHERPSTSPAIREDAEDGGAKRAEYICESENQCLSLIDEWLVNAGRKRAKIRTMESVPFLSWVARLGTLRQTEKKSIASHVNASHLHRIDVSIDEAESVRVNVNSPRPEEGPLKPCQLVQHLEQRP